MKNQAAKTPDLKLSEEDVILRELKKVATRLLNQGYNMNGVGFGINKKQREEGKLLDFRQKETQNIETQEDDEGDNSAAPKESIPEGHVIWKPEDDFIKLYPGALNKISLKLTGAETLTLLKLLPCIDYQSGMLKKGKDDPLITKDIIALTGFSKVTVISIMAKLVSERVLARNEVGRTVGYFINPFIFFKGRYINHTLIEMFIDHKKQK
jgi:hypothetical protein